jgi:rRNA maturation endonuclease Nob1
MNARAKDSYAEKRFRIKGNRRICNGCGAILSQYNDENKCTICLGKLEAQRARRLRNKVNGQDR